MMSFNMFRTLLFCISAAHMNRRRDGALVWLIHPDQESTGRCGLMPGEGRHNIGGLMFPTRLEFGQSVK